MSTKIALKNLPPIRFGQCPEAMEFIRYELINLSDIAPESEDAHNSARANGIDQSKVTKWKDRIDAGGYTPTAGGDITPPTVKKLSQNPDGYLYQMLDGHTRRQAFMQLNSTEPFLVAIVKFHDCAPHTATEWEMTFMSDCNDPEASNFIRTPSTDADKLKLMENLAQGMASRFTPTMSDTETQSTVMQCVDELLVRARRTTKKFRTAAYNYVLGALGESSDLKQLIVRHHLQPAKDAYINELCEPLDLDPADAIIREFTVGDPLGSEYDYRIVRKLLQAGMENLSVLETKYIVGQLTKQKSATKLLSPTEVRNERVRKSTFLQDTANEIMRFASWLSVRKNYDTFCGIPSMWVPQVHNDPDHLFMAPSRYKVPHS